MDIERIDEFEEKLSWKLVLINTKCAIHYNNDFYSISIINNNVIIDNIWREFPAHWIIMTLIKRGWELEIYVNCM